MQYFLDRIREPSTWSGLGLLTALVGVPPSTFGLIQQVVIGLAGLYSVFGKEKAA